MTRLIFSINQISVLNKAFANNLSANIKLLATQLSKMVQSGGFLQSYAKQLEQAREIQ